MRLQTMDADTTRVMQKLVSPSSQADLVPSSSPLGKDDDAKTYKYYRSTTHTLAAFTKP